VNLESLPGGSRGAVFEILLVCAGSIAAFNTTAVFQTDLSHYHFISVRSTAGPCLTLVTGSGLQFRLSVAVPYILLEFPGRIAVLKTDWGGVAGTVADYSGTVAAAPRCAKGQAGRRKL